MIIQACLNGARPAAFHPALPLTSGAMANDAAACIAVGASEFHIHPRDGQGRESLGAVDETVLAVRAACPGSLIGVSTGAWIEGNAQRTLVAIEAWRELPDHASVNLSEPEAPAVMQLLARRGIGIEAGLASVADAERLVSLTGGPRVLRILIEVEEQDVPEAWAVALATAEVLDRAGLRRPVLLHGFDATVWDMVRLARQRCWSTRVGLEDGSRLPDGSIALDNSALIESAKSLLAA